MSSPAGYKAAKAKLLRRIIAGEQCYWQFDGLLQERGNSIANAPELRLSCTNRLSSSSILRKFDTGVKNEYTCAGHEVCDSTLPLNPTAPITGTKCPHESYSANKMTTTFPVIIDTVQDQ